MIYLYLYVYPHSIDLEFRGFVYNGQFTALTQYNEYVYFPALRQRKEEILDLIKSQFDQKILPVISLKNYVVDFILCTEKEEEYNTRDNRFTGLKVFIVELNPLAGIVMRNNL